MSPEMVVALIAAGASIVCVIIGIFAARDAHRSSAKAQESSKRMEQLRAQGTKVGEGLIGTVAEMMIGSEKVLYVLEQEGEPAVDDKEANNKFIRLIEPIGFQIPKLRALLYASAIYITPEITQEIETILEFLVGPDRRFPYRSKHVERIC